MFKSCFRMFMKIKSKKVYGCILIVMFFVAMFYYFEEFNFKFKQIFHENHNYTLTTNILPVIDNLNSNDSVLVFTVNKNYDNFDYPLNVDIRPFIDQWKNNSIPLVPPINTYNYTFLKPCEEKCKEVVSLDLIIIVKSAKNNFARRQGIRNTYGNEKRFSNLFIKTVFLLGIETFKVDNEFQNSVDTESKIYSDIIQADFIDTYFNNTIKTMMGFNWLMKYCSNAKFYYFTDDDMYVSVKNLLSFIKNPLHYPKIKVKNEKMVFQNKNINENLSFSSKEKFKDFIAFKNHSKRDDQNENITIENMELYAGFVYASSSPYRNKNSKWYISFDEYRWKKWPPFIPAGAYILSKSALITLYYGSFYTKNFRFDDIYLAIIAKKSGIVPLNCKEFYNRKKKYTVQNYRYVISSHGYSDPLELLEVWNKQRQLGYA